MLTTSSSRRRRHHVGADADAEHARAATVGCDRWAGRQHGLLDEPAVGDRERRSRTSASSARRHGRRSISTTSSSPAYTGGRSPTTTPNAVWWAAGGAARASIGGNPVASTTSRASTSPPSVSSRLPHSKCRTALASATRTSRPSAEVGAQGCVVDDTVRPLDDVAAVAVDDDARRDDGEAAVGHVGDVVAPRAVRRRPRLARPDDDDGRQTGACGTPRRAPGRPDRRRRRRRRGPDPSFRRALERGHPAELLDDVGAPVRRVERAVHGLDVDGDAPASPHDAEVVAGADRGAAISLRRLERVDPGVVAGRRLPRRRTRGSRAPRRRRPCR